MCLFTEFFSNQCPPILGIIRRMRVRIFCIVCSKQVHAKLTWFGILLPCALCCSSRRAKRLFCPDCKIEVIN